MMPDLDSDSGVPLREDLGIRRPRFVANAHDRTVRSLGIFYRSDGPCRNRSLSSRAVRLRRIPQTLHSPIEVCSTVCQRQ